MLGNYTSEWVKYIVDSLTARDTERDYKRLMSLIQENSQQGGHQKGFIYGGDFYYDQDSTILERSEMKSLKLALKTEFVQFLQDRRAFYKEKQKLTQGISNLLVGCKNEQDIRDALPEIMITSLDHDFPARRQKEEAWTLRNKPLQFNEYEQTRGLIDFFITSRMLY